MPQLGNLLIKLHSVQDFKFRLCIPTDQKNRVWIEGYEETLGPGMLRVLLADFVGDIPQQHITKVSSCLDPFPPTPDAVVRPSASSLLFLSLLSSALLFSALLSSALPLSSPISPSPLCSCLLLAIVGRACP